MRIGTVTLNPVVDRYYFLAEDFVLYGLNRVETVEKYPAGKGMNVSVVLKKLGYPSLVLGCIGGENGRYLRERLEAQGIPHHLTEIAGETRTNIKLLELATKKVTEINEPGPVISPEELEKVKREIVSRGKELEYVIISGSLPLGVPKSIYADLIAALRPYTRVILDADGEQLRLGVEEAPYLVKPNRHEVQELLEVQLKTKEDFKEAARQLFAKGIEYVVITDGAEGALFAYKDKFLWAGTPPVKVGSPIGCGDSLLAGVVVGLIQNYTWEETARLALAVATATVMKEGTAFPERQEVEAVLNMVQVKEV